MNLRRILDYAAMLNDPVRMRAYEAAIRAVCPGKVVCELGVGLGPLSLMALKAGAQRVYGIELDEGSLQVATEVLRANGFDRTRFLPVRGVSTRAKLPEKVDVVLSETLDSFGVGEQTVAFMDDARRFLKPGGVFLPERLDCLVALASPAEYRARRALWAQSLAEAYGLDYTPMLERVRACKHTLPVREPELFSGWARWQQITLGDGKTFARTSPVLLPGLREGEVLGIASAFEVTLAGAIKLRTLPEDPPTHWQQAFNAFPNPVHLKDGDAVYLELVTDPSASLDSLRLELRVASGPRAEVEAVALQRAPAVKRPLARVEA
ncbi:MAG: methyltransferase domain-containing protein [Deltaproteobacteria bacterium]|nr:methyltransferase domain-containing protein [Deltaproteobacteria bacterium]